ALTTLPFAPVTIAEPELAWWQDDKVLEWGKLGLAGLVSLLILLFGVRPAIRALSPRKEEAPEAVGDTAQAALVSDDSHLLAPAAPPTHRARGRGARGRRRPGPRRPGQRRLAPAGARRARGAGPGTAEDLQRTQSAGRDPPAGARLGSRTSDRTPADARPPGARAGLRGAQALE